jgi:hypothetical protein
MFVAVRGRSYPFVELESQCQSNRPLLVFTKERAPSAVPDCATFDAADHDSRTLLTELAA